MESATPAMASRQAWSGQGSAFGDYDSKAYRACRSVAT
jgi:hypothetical protein